MDVNLMDYQTRTTNTMVNCEKIIVNAFANYGGYMADFREAMQDLLKNEFSESNCNEICPLIEARAFATAKIKCYENGTFLVEQKVSRWYDQPKIESKKVKSFNDLLKCIKENDLLIQDIENMNFLTFKQVQKIITIFDVKKQVEF